jgi:hypothetical protein
LDHFPVTLLAVGGRPSGTPSVSKALRALAWPALAEHGFTAHTQRSAWRRRQHLIDVVNFQAAVSDGDPLYVGPAGHAPLGSFAVNLGVYFAFRSALPFTRSPFTFPKDPDRPEEFMCDCRTRLSRIAHPAHPQFPEELWPVREDGSDARDAVNDALMAIHAHGLSWFEGSGRLEAVFMDYRQRCQVSLENTRYQDPFFRHEDVFVAAAVALGRVEDAIELYEAIVARPVDPKERADHERAEQRRMRRSLREPDKPLLRIAHPHWHDEACSRLEVLRRLRVQ